MKFFANLGAFLALTLLSFGAQTAFGQSKSLLQANAAITDFPSKETGLVRTCLGEPKGYASWLPKIQLKLLFDTDNSAKVLGRMNGESTARKWGFITLQQQKDGMFHFDILSWNNVGYNLKAATRPQPIWEVRGKYTVDEPVAVTFICTGGV